MCSSSSSQLPPYRIQEPEALILSAGLIGAAGAIVLQDVLKNFVGGLAILGSEIYSIGDRIEVDQWLGDVVEIGLLYTTLLEMRAWVSGDQATGRLVSVPNAHAMTGVVSNYTKDFPFLWDEIKFPISQDSDIPYAMERFESIAESVTEEEAKGARVALTEVVMAKYYLTLREVKPTVYMSFNDDWVDIFVRYITRVHERTGGTAARYIGSCSRRSKIRIGSRSGRTRWASTCFPRLGWCRRADDGLIGARACFRSRPTP